MSAGTLLAAPDKFRATATAREVADAIARTARRAGLEARACPLADGGEGLLDVVGGERRESLVTGPGGAPVAAAWAWFAEPVPTAVIEMAQASGLERAGGPAQNDAVEATTRGTGELVACAIESGARRIVVGCGGSATTDGGAGALEVLAEPGLLDDVTLEIACDVRTRFVSAARTFAPQKGANPPQVAELERRLVRLGAEYRRRFGLDVTELDGAGAAGGLAGGLAALGGRLVSGFDVVAGLCGFEAALGGARLVVTGEGSLDATSLEGKVVTGVLRAVNGRLPVLVLAGRATIGARELARACGIEDAPPVVVSLADRFGIETAMAEPLESVSAIVKEWLDTEAPSARRGDGRDDARCEAEGQIADGGRGPFVPGRPVGSGP